MRQNSTFALHGIAASIMAWGWFTLLKQGPIGEITRSQMGGHFQYLTNQGLIIALAHMVVSLFCDTFPSVTIFRRIKTALLMMSMPIAFVVSTIYWSFLFFFPDLLLSPEAMLPLPMDLALHVAPLATLLIDFFVFEARFSEAYVRRGAPAALVAFSVWYASFLEYCATFNGFFPYPFLTYSSLPVRVLCYVATAGFGLCCFNTLNALHPTR